MANLSILQKPFRALAFVIQPLCLSIEAAQTIPVKLPTGETINWPARVLILGYGVGPNAVWGPEARSAAFSLISFKSQSPLTQGYTDLSDKL